MSRDRASTDPLRSEVGIRRRRRRLGRSDVVDLTETMASTRDDVADVATRDRLARAFDALSYDHRAVVVLHHLAGLPLDEVARVLDIPYGTVGSRLHHAMRAMRASIEAAERTRGSRRTDGMTAMTDFDRLVADWLETRGPTELRAGAVEEALAVARSKRQRRGLAALQGLRLGRHAMTPILVRTPVGALRGRIVRDGSKAGCHGLADVTPLGQVRGEPLERLEAKLPHPFALDRDHVVPVGQEFAACVRVVRSAGSTEDGERWPFSSRRRGHGHPRRPSGPARVAAVALDQRGHHPPVATASFEGLLGPFAEDVGPEGRDERTSRDLVRGSQGTRRHVALRPGGGCPRRAIAAETRRGGRSCQWARRSRRSPSRHPGGDAELGRRTGRSRASPAIPWHPLRGYARRRGDVVDGTGGPRRGPSEDDRGCATAGRSVQTGDTSTFVRAACRIPTDHRPTTRSARATARTRLEGVEDGFVDLVEVGGDRTSPRDGPAARARSRPIGDEAGDRPARSSDDDLLTRLDVAR